MGPLHLANSRIHAELTRQMDHINISIFLNKSGFKKPLKQANTTGSLSNVRCEKQQMKWKIPLGVAIGGLLALFYVSIIAGRSESIDGLLAPLWLLTSDLCQNLGESFYGSSEGGMLFIVPLWVAYGAISGALISSCICLVTHLMMKKQSTEPDH